MQSEHYSVAFSESGGCSKKKSSHEVCHLEKELSLSSQVLHDVGERVRQPRPLHLTMFAHYRDRGGAKLLTFANQVANEGSVVSGINTVNYGLTFFIDHCYARFFAY